MEPPENLGRFSALNVPTRGPGLSPDGVRAFGVVDLAAAASCFLTWSWSI
jgi:hypothetical protein